MNGETFTDSNASPAVAVDGDSAPSIADLVEGAAARMGGIGDFNSDAGGSGARYNVGKPAIDLIPLRLVADSFVDPQRDRFSALPATLAALYAVGEFQETHDRRALDTAIRYLSPYWEQCARVFDYGQRKYATWNWAKGMSWTAVVGSFGRHAVAKLRGEDYDPESKQMQEGHMLCNLVILRMYADIYLEGNDLPPPKLFRSAPIVRDADAVRAAVKAMGEGAIYRAPYSRETVEVRKSIVIFGPSGCGKTRNAEALANFYGLTEIVDDWGGQPFPTYGALVLTSNRSHADSVRDHQVAFPVAMIAAGLAVGS